jgi:hypothetical protein
MTLRRAKTTTIRWANCAPFPSPNRNRIHSAPVMTPERRSQVERKTMRTIWLKTGHSHGIQMLLNP